MKVIIVGRLPEKMAGALAAVSAAGFDAHGTFSEREALDEIDNSSELFAVVTGGAVDDAAFSRIVDAARPKGAVLIRTSIGFDDARAHFDAHVVPRLVAARERIEAGDRSDVGRPLRPRIGVIVGSVRDGRFAEVPAKWIAQRVMSREGIGVETLDLRDFDLPFYDARQPPARKTERYGAGVERWSQKVGVCDGFVVVTPEYNHGPSGVLKNAIDWVYREWTRKPVTFVAYGNAGGARAVEQLRLIAVELEMVPLKTALHLPGEVVLAHHRGAPSEEILAPFEAPAKKLLDELVWWTQVLAEARHRLPPGV